MAALDAQSAGKLELLAGAAVEGKCPDGLSSFKVGSEAKVRGGMAQEPPLKGGHQRSQPGDLDRNAAGGGPAASARGFADENELRREAGNLGIPGGLLIAGKCGHLGKVLSQAGIPSFQLGQEFVTDSVSRVGEMAIGRVVAPTLAAVTKEGFDFCAGGTQQRTKDGAIFELRVDSGKAFGPCPSQELCQDGFGLIVEGMGGGNCVERD